MSKPEIELPVFADTIGAVIERWDGIRPVIGVDYADNLSGNPGMFHGGIVAMLLEMAAVATLDADLKSGRGAAHITPVNITVDYLRPAGEQRTFASARIVRSGRRLANVQASLWQDSEEKLVATAIVNLEIGAGGRA